MSEPLDALPKAFRSKAREVLQNPTHETTLPDSDVNIRVECSLGEATLFALVDPETHRIMASRHDSAPRAELRAVMELLCRVIEGLPIKEAAEHGAHRVLSLLADGKRFVAGIQLPGNAGDEFVHAEMLVRGLRDNYVRETDSMLGEYRYADPPSTDWVERTESERLRALRNLLSSFEQSADLQAGTILLDGLEPDINGHPVRVTVLLSPKLPAESKPSLLFEAEAWLKSRLEPSLQIYLAELKDKSQLRRL